jgi:hypothetical protein
VVAQGWLSAIPNDAMIAGLRPEIDSPDGLSHAVSDAVRGGIIRMESDNLAVFVSLGQSVRRPRGRVAIKNALGRLELRLENLFDISRELAFLCYLRSSRCIEAIILFIPSPDYWSSIFGALWLKWP